MAPCGRVHVTQKIADEALEHVEGALMLAWICASE